MLKKVVWETHYGQRLHQVEKRKEPLELGAEGPFGHKVPGALALQLILQDLFSTSADELLANCHSWISRMSVSSPQAEYSQENAET